MKRNLFAPAPTASRLKIKKTPNDKVAHVDEVARIECMALDEVVVDCRGVVIGDSMSRVSDKVARVIGVQCRYASS